MSTVWALRVWVSLCYTRDATEQGTDLALKGKLFSKASHWPLQTPSLRLFYNNSQRVISVSSYTRSPGYSRGLCLVQAGQGQACEVLELEEIIHSHHPYVQTTPTCKRCLPGNGLCPLSFRLGGAGAVCPCEAASPHPHLLLLCLSASWAHLFLKRKSVDVCFSVWRNEHSKTYFSTSWITLKHYIVIRWVSRNQIFCRNGNSHFIVVKPTCPLSAYNFNQPRK